MFNKFGLETANYSLIKEVDKIKPTAKQETDTLIKQKQDEFFKVEHVYNTIAIEGNTLTYSETARVILDNITVKEKPLRCHLEAVNSALAFDFVQKLSESRQPLTEREILEIHSIVLNDNLEHRGKYRQVPVWISGSSVQLAAPLEIPARIAELLEMYHESTEHILVKIAEFHVFFEQIHPFIGGNGRTGRFILNLELLRAGYLPINIKFADRDLYMESLQTAQLTGDTNGFIGLFLRELLGSYKKFAH